MHGVLSSTVYLQGTPSATLSISGVSVYPLEWTKGMVLDPRPYVVNEHHCLGCAADLVLLYRTLDLLRHEPCVDQRVDFSCNTFFVSVCHGIFVSVFLLLCKQVK